MLADLHYTRGRLGKAERAYRQALSVDDENVQALNNLAWLYATSPEKSGFYRPQQALELAEKAAAGSSEPHVLDTLAESYYVNGMYEKAFETGQLALSKAGADRGHFRKQLEKFTRALQEDNP